MFQPRFKPFHQTNGAITALTSIITFIIIIFVQNIENEKNNNNFCYINHNHRGRWGALAYYATYSDGYRVGVITKFSRKGMIFKTYEGELDLGYLKANGGGIGNNRKLKTEN